MDENNTAIDRFFVTTNKDTEATAIRQRLLSGEGVPAAIVENIGKLEINQQNNVIIVHDKGATDIISDILSDLNLFVLSVDETAVTSVSRLQHFT